MNTSEKQFILKDIYIVALSILVAILLVKTDALVAILTSSKELEAWGSFITGMFFTSVFTTAPAIVTLGEIAQSNSVFSTAIFGAFGAVVGDLVIFRFIRDRLSEHLTEVFSHQKVGKKLKILWKHKYFRYFTFLLGGLVIASPLPDEIGISMLGFSRMKMSWFLGISFVFNFIGIYIIGILARVL